MMFVMYSVLHVFLTQHWPNTCSTLSEYSQVHVAGVCVCVCVFKGGLVCMHWISRGAVSDSKEVKVKAL